MIMSPFQKHFPSQLKPRSLVVDCSHLRVSKLSEYGRKPFVINVAVRFYGHVQDMDRLVLHTLGDKGITGFTLRYTSHRSMTGLWLSAFCHLAILFSIQDRIASLWEGWTWGRRVREAAQHVVYVPVEEERRKKKRKEKSGMRIIPQETQSTPADGMHHS